MPLNSAEILLDKYRLEALIGQGAFGEVYRVSHLGLNVLRAVKVLRREAPGVGSTEFSDYKVRFQFEAQLGARLNTPTSHPQLLQVFNYEEKGDLLLLEMEYASGGSLADHLAVLKEQGKAMPVEDAVKMGLEISRGLSALHELDIVHRDLKPSNILFDGQGHAKVADLGLAQAHGSDSHRSQLSNPRPHPGTPAYMSPEQETTRSYLAPASDVYALGLVLFESLTGHIYRSQRPGTRVGSLRPDIPGWLDNLLVRMLSADPKDRPWNGLEAASLLQEGLEGETAKQKAEIAQQAAQEEARLEMQARQKKEAEDRQRWEAERRTRQEAEIKARQAAEDRSRREAQRRKPLPKPGVPGWAWVVGTLVFTLLFLAIILGMVAQDGGTGATQTPATAVPTGLPAIAVPTLGIGSTWTRPADGMLMVYVPQGEFNMGSNDISDAPVHTVTLDAYWIDQTEVTNAMFSQCVSSGACQSPSSNASNTRTSYYDDPRYAHYPIIYVDWNQANAYCQWAAARLPTEAEWEKAARGPDAYVYPWGNNFDGNIANFCDKNCAYDWADKNFNDGYADTSPVGSYLAGASSYGALDMAGNVWEWVADWYDETYYRQSPESNPTGPGSGTMREVRGGAWSINEPGVRTTYRGPADPGQNFNNTGFRCSRGISP